MISRQQSKNKQLEERVSHTIVHGCLQCQVDVADGVVDGCDGAVEGYSVPIRRYLGWMCLMAMVVTRVPLDVRSVGCDGKRGHWEVSRRSLDSCQQQRRFLRTTRAWSGGSAETNSDFHERIFYRIPIHRTNEYSIILSLLISVISS